MSYRKDAECFKFYRVYDCVSLKKFHFDNLLFMMSLKKLGQTSIKILVNNDELKNFIHIYSAASIFILLL